MAPIRAASAPHAPLEDPLDYLPCSQVAEYKKGQIVYNQNEPSTSVYLILEGKVKVFRLAEGGRQVLMNIYLTDEFFGESACCTFRDDRKAPWRWRTPNSWPGPRRRSKSWSGAGRAWASRSLRCWRGAPQRSNSESRALARITLPGASCVV